jgi:hypothetical protein
MSLSLFLSVLFFYAKVPCEVHNPQKKVSQRCRGGYKENKQSKKKGASNLYPHSLSYQATTLTISSPITIVRDESMVDETSLHLKSTETSGTSQTARMPLSGPSAAFLKAALTSSAVMPFFATLMTRSTTETFGVGTRSAIPLSFPFNCGRTRDTAFAAPVLVGTMFSAAARARLRSR